MYSKMKIRPKKLCLGFSLNIFYLNFMTYIHIYIYTHYKRIRTEA